MILIKQIESCLVIDFQIADTNFEPCLVILFHLAEYVAERAWNDTSISITFCTTSYGESLTWASLTISKNCAIITFKAIINDIFGDIFKDWLLLGQHIKNASVHKVVVIVTNLIVP